MIDFDKLLHSVTYWLSYQERIGRSFMIQESSLKYPVADYLTGTGLSVELIDLEYPHRYIKLTQMYTFAVYFLFRSAS